RALLGLLGLLVLAYVANHPRVRRLEDWLGLRSAITAGFPFVALGLLARHPAVGVLTDDVLVALTPLIDFGLGWIGFLVGYHLDLRAVDRLPRGTALVIALDTAIPLVAIGIFSGVALIVLGFTWRSEERRVGKGCRSRGSRCEERECRKRETVSSEW